ncbi:hypothetical protein [Chryseobacterium sp. Leaf180]|uniref:hypothetical protein n=1 Tax=Chryseobacterium sp. Leaf180 TaxID=1736289 RepID=UPI00103D92D4|nr:hypothetical protein [Chryseobacterium sp. Leaf180]
MTPTNKLTIKDDKVIYEQDPQNMWILDIDKIKFIGEYTTSAGPLADDWFFVFADTLDQWWQAPTLALDHEQFWKQLGEKLNCEIAPGLFASTNWATRVIYPKSLEGQELFVVVKAEAKPKTFWQKLFGSDDNNEHLELTDNVKQLFK